MKLLYFLFLLPIPLLAQQNGRYESLEAALREPEKVIHLELWSQPITSLPKDIRKLKNVKTMVLRGCDLTVLPKSFKHLNNLEEVSLGNNARLNHQQVCSVLKKLPNLKQLDFESSNMMAIPKDLLLFPKLDELFLGSNQISSQAIDAFKQLRPTINVYE